MSEFRPVQTIQDFFTLDDGDVLEGYLDGVSGSAEPDSTRSRGYWHGWQNGMIESGRLPPTSAYVQLKNAFRQIA